MRGILAEIIAHKQTEVASLDGPALRRKAELAPAPRNFLAALRSSQPMRKESLEAAGRTVALIAELKRASPSRGMLAPRQDLFQVAEIYAENGARAISVLTDRKYFQGELKTLQDLRFKQQIPLPLLRKDFIVDERQLYESRANGADAILLIVDALPDQGRLAGLHALALELDLTPVVEVHAESEVERALNMKGLQLIGINNRNLDTFEVDLKTTERLRPLIPLRVAVVAESGIFTAQDVERLGRAQVEAVLVGEALITAADLPAKVRELSAIPIRPGQSIGKAAVGK